MENPLSESTSAILFFLSCFWFYSLIPWMFVLGGGVDVILVPTVITLVLAVILINPYVPEDISASVAMYLGVASVALCIISIIGFFLWHPVVIPLLSLIQYFVAHPNVMSILIFGPLCLVTGIALYIHWKTGPAVDWSMLLRMSVSMLVLAFLTVGFFTAVWGIIEYVAWHVLAVRIEPDTRVFLTGVFGVGLVARCVYHKIRGISTAERYGDATPVTVGEYPTLHSITTKVAAQLDVPLPTIAVSERTEPEAITVGYRPGAVCLILSQGTLDSLDDAELEAVVAHELAHVANMDAIVMTIASMPILLSKRLIDGLGSTDSSEDDESNVNQTYTNEEHSLFRRVLRKVLFVPRRIISFVGSLISPIVSYLWKRSPHHLVWLALWIVALVTILVSRPPVSVIARARESAADRTAAMVTGSPAALASALRTLDEQIAETPDNDLRETSNLSSLSILPLNPISINLAEEDQLDEEVQEELAEEEPVDEEFDNTMGSTSGILTRIARMLFAMHPPTERRIDALDDLAKKQQTGE
jgi:heat shock protein HtpX